MQKITTFLWFDDQAEQAANYYVSIFKEDSRILHVSHYGEVGPEAAGKVMVVSFQLAGQQYYALNGGPHYKFSHAISLYVDCDTQEEVDYYWEKLSAGGAQVQCGWLTDKYGLSWQVVPSILQELLQDKHRGKADRVMKAMLQMQKLDIAGLKKAYDG